MTNLESTRRIEDFKHQVINSTLLVATVLGLISFLIVPIPLKVSSFTFDLITDIASIFLAFLIYILRNRISITLKSIAIFVLLFNVFITDLLTFGVYSFDKVFIIAIPFYALLIYDIRRTLIIFLLAVVAYFIIGYLFITGKISLRDDLIERALDLHVWIESFVLITLVTAIIVVFTNRYNKNLSELINQLQNQNIELARHQEALAESERKYREIFNDTSDAIFVQDAENGTVIDVNNTMLKMYGYERIDKVIGKSIEDFSAKEFGYNHEEASINVVAADYEQPYTFEWLAKKKNGDSFKVEVSLKKTLIGGVDRILAVVRDISEREKAKQEKKETEERYRMLVETFPDMVMISDLEGNIIYGNEQLEKITGITKVDYSNPKRKAHIHPEDLPQVREVMKEFLESEETYSPNVENRFIDTWDQLHWFNGKMSKIYLNEKLYLQTVTRDITEKKQMDLELEKYRQNLEELVKERTEDLQSVNEKLQIINEELYEKTEIIGRQNDELKSTLQHLKETQSQLLHAEKMASLGILTAGVAHEINNPLNFIMGGYNILKDYFDEWDETIPEDVSTSLSGIKTGIERAVTIVNSLNQFSRDSDTYEEAVNIHSILNNCLVMLQAKTKNKIEIRKELTRQKITLKGNVGKLHQVFINILNNSIQAIPEKGTINISTKKVRQNLVVEIADTGTGIDEKDLKRITDPFFTTKDPGDGTGLGLFITYSIIKEHNGTLDFESQRGKGTKTIISFPVQG